MANRVTVTLEAKDEASKIFDNFGGTMRNSVLQANLLAGFSFKAHPHQLRHACGYYLANKGYDTRMIQAWLGHRNIQHTVRYTQLAAGRFDSIEWS